MVKLTASIKIITPAQNGINDIKTSGFNIKNKPKLIHNIPPSKLTFA